MDADGKPPLTEDLSASSGSEASPTADQKSKDGWVFGKGKFGFKVGNSMIGIDFSGPSIGVVDSGDSKDSKKDDKDSKFSKE